jgi:two-component system, cell cycle response regulator DivK
MVPDLRADTSEATDRPAILVVDDDEDSRRILMYGLGSAGYRVIVAANGASAVELCQVVLPNLVIMDLAMPEMDGYEATRALKSDERTRDVPVIAWSARIFPSDAPELLTAGFDEVLAKPAHPADVIEAVRRHVPIRAAAPRAD